MADVTVRAYYENGTLLKSCDLDLSASSNYEVYGIYGAFVNATSFSPETDYSRTAGSNLARVNGVSKSTYASTKDPTTNTDTIGFKSSGTGWISFYFKNPAQTITITTNVYYDYEYGDLPYSTGTTTLNVGDTYTIAELISATGASTIGEFEDAYYASTRYSSLTDTITLNDWEDTLEVFFVPAPDYGIGVYFYKKDSDGTYQDYDSCTITGLSSGTTYTVAGLYSVATNPSGDYRITPPSTAYQKTGWSVNSNTWVKTPSTDTSHALYPASDGSAYVDFYYDKDTVTNIAYIYNGSAWVPATPYVYNGSAWVQATPNIYNGSAWKP